MGGYIDKVKLLNYDILYILSSVKFVRISLLSVSNAQMLKYGTLIF